MATVTFRHGSEGPEHDPYAFTEITFVRTDGITVVFHSGLGESCRVYKGEGRRRRSHLLPGLDWSTATGDDAAPCFEEATGVPLAWLTRYEHRKQNPRKCRKCGCKKLGWMSGFAGESFLVCKKCDHFNAFDFNEAAII